MVISAVDDAETLQVVDINGVDEEDPPQPISGNDVDVVDTAITDGSFDATVFIPAQPEAGTITITATQGDDTPTAVFTVTVPPLEHPATTSTVPGSNQRLELRAMIDVDLRDAITVKLEKFGVPSSIDADDVEITDADNVTGNPSSVSVSGTTVTLYFTDLNGPGTDPENVDGDELDDDESTTITFLKRAGITLPTSSGELPDRSLQHRHGP